MDLHAYKLNSLCEFESQPNEIITHILSYLDNYTLNLSRRTCHRWKMLIETRIVAKNVPSLHQCILNRDYYYFGKYYLNYEYCTQNILLYGIFATNEKNYYVCLDKLIGEPHLIKKIYINDKISKEQLLYYSSSNGHLEVVKYLIDNGANIHASGDHPLHVSVANGQLEVVKYLINKGADIHAWADCALTWSVEYNHLDVVKYLIEKGANIHVHNDHIIKCGAKNGYVDVVKYLINCGADKNIALRYGTKEIIEAISEKID